MQYQIGFEQEEDDRWIAEITALPGVMAYGMTRNEAESKVEAMALRGIADRIERENSTMTQSSSRSHESLACLQSKEGLQSSSANRLEGTSPHQG